MLKQVPAIVSPLLQAIASSVVGMLKQLLAIYQHTVAAIAQMIYHNSIWLDSFLNYSNHLLYYCISLKLFFRNC